MRNLFKIAAWSLLSCLWLITAVVPAGAADGGRASGTFESKGASLKITDAYAFYGTPSLGGKEKVIVVAVSNAGFVKSELDAYWDRKNAIERYFRDEKTGIVYFEFDQAGRYRGLSYYVGPGNGCGYCADTSVQSTVRVKDNRIAGKLSFPEGNDPNRWFDLSFDVSVSDNDHGRPQGATGGEPGKAYVAYHRALSGKDMQAIRSLLSEERKAAWDKAETQGKAAAFLAFLREDHPKEVRVTEAYIKEDRALLLLEGKGEMGKVRGEAQFSRQKGAWRFEEETFSLIIK